LLMPIMVEETKVGLVHGLLGHCYYPSL